ncbi:LacI family DNA-binding transcriptional regulator [Microbacterium sp. GXF7504]
MVSVKDVAVAAGVSVGTVSNVLNRPDRVTPATVDRVHAAIDRLGYVPNDAARQLRAGRSRCIGMIVQDLRNPFYAALVRAAEDRAAEAGLTVLVADSRGDHEQEVAHLSLFERQRALGILVAPLSPENPHAGELAARGTQVVLVDAHGGDASLPTVTVDDAAGGRAAMERLLTIGRRHVTFVGGPMSVRQIAGRFAGARATAEAHGLRLDVLEPTDLTVLGGRRAAEALAALAPAERPDAVFAANDLLALGVLQGLHMSGAARVPDDVAVIGYDDIDFAASAVVPLTSVRQPADEIGARAVDLLLSPGDGPTAVTLRPELVVRESA